MTIVFVGMETSGQLRRRFQAAGYETYSCDRLPSEDGGEEMAYGPGPHGQLPMGRHMVGDVFQTLDHLAANDMQPALAVFHPDCTYLTNSAAWAYMDPDFAKYPGVGYHQRVKPETLVGAERRAAREEALNVVRRLMDLPIEAKVLENPPGSIGSMIMPATQIVNPYQFGDDASKATCLWMLGDKRKHLQELMLAPDPRKWVAPRIVCPVCKGVTGLEPASAKGCPTCGCEAGLLRPRWANQTDSGQNRLTPGDDRWKDRARTYDGIADALVASCVRFLKKRGL